MNKKSIIEKTKEFVRNKLEGEGSGHDWWHIVRVYNSAKSIATQPFLPVVSINKGNQSEEESFKEKNHEFSNEIDMFVVELGALLHDIADHKFGFTDGDRKTIITDFLESLEVEKKTIEHVVYIANIYLLKVEKTSIRWKR